MKSLLKITVLAASVFMTGTACAQNNDDESKPVTERFKIAGNAEQKPEMLPLVESRKVKNVIFMIGDGTGIAQITAGQYALVGTEGRLHIQTMPVTGIVETAASDNLITDSAAGATAYSCGIKTYNGAIGLDSEKNPCKTILEYAEQHEMATGIVATSTISHATPASFAAHVESRSMENEIAADYLSSGADIILGGGQQHFIPQNMEGSEREDERNLITEFEQKGYTFVSSGIELAQSDDDQILGLFANSALSNRDEEPTLAEMTSKAIEVLSKNENGFFLMVEGSQIDWAGHDNDVKYVIREVQSFDEAVKNVLDFAVQDGETLVILTADHETGGMTLQRQHENGEELEIYWTTEQHTGTPVPLLAYGPRALEFMGWRSNTYVGNKMMEILFSE